MNKRNEKSVGATSSRPHFEEMTKYNKGITLIALIITIIVMLILVGVTVNVALNGGLFDTAKQAASGMSMAQIQERAEMVKYMLKADVESGNITGVVKAEYLNRLKTEFGVTDNEIKNNKIVIEDGKYDIVIKNADLDIEVREHTDYVDTTSILSLNYRTSNTEVDGKIYATTMHFELGTNFTEEEYVQLKQEEAANKTINQKREIVLEYLSAEDGITITSIDHYCLVQINEVLEKNKFDTCNTLKECLANEVVRGFFELEDDEELTEGQIYNYFINGNISKEMTEEEVVESLHSSIDYESIAKNEYAWVTRRLKTYITDNNEEKPFQGTHIYTDVYEGTETLSYSIYKNGTYDFIVKDYQGTEIFREKIVINNIETINNPVIVPEGGDWTIIASSIGRYIGNDSNVIVPLQIGNTKSNHMYDTFQQFSTSSYNYDFLESVIVPEGMRSIGVAAFTGCSNLKNVSLPSSLTSIGSDAFKNCTSLEEITLPNKLTRIIDYSFENCTSLTEITIPSSVTTIYSDAFNGCTSLTTIYVEAGSTLTIPETKPWGAPNATVTVLPAE